MYTPPADKVLHVVSGGLATVLGLALGLLSLRLGASAPLPVWGLGACLVAALVREVWNVLQGGSFSRADVAATLLGSALPLLGYGLAVWAAQPN